MPTPQPNDVPATVDTVRAAFHDPTRRHEQLREGLAERADAAGVLDIGYRTIDSPIGALLLAATPAGLVRVAFELENHEDVLTELAARVSPRILHASRRLDSVAWHLDEFLSGRPVTFDDVRLDLQLARGFRREVLEHLRQISYGSRESYAEVAAAIGRPAAVRAVGSACATNPLPLVVPCHRVVRSDGSIGQYGGGADVKRALLDMEAA